ncbi:aminoglycoside phosphotransferase family protein [Nonomuraea terrae]|uniref:Aminoglycoside phosphotransferase family protein n=1 Tax=Nonomuraea terrae TaxID=2530383 RepID=A0A4R4YDT0_9ACTN|nr:aminoglycoside phosphotransferase family protein [Nonomuraea terrae]TDD41332.1 aminoglycoside phosphotransferase family protein [Nonomuraea terrae]
MIPNRAAVSAAVTVAEAHGVRVREPVVLNDSFNLRIHLRPAPVVARVPTVTALGRARPADALAREVAVASFLHAAGAPVVPPSDLLPAGPHVHHGVTVSFWAHVDHDPGHAVTPDAAGRALAGLHAALRGFPGGLPRLGPVLDEPVRLLSALAGSGVVEPDVLALLRDSHAELTARLRDVDGLQAVHGDAHPGNLLATPGGLLWNDFEETMAGPPGWDVACLLRTTRLDGRAAVRAYGADPDDPGLAVYVAARGLQGTLWVLARAAHSPQWLPAARQALQAWLNDPTGMTRALR